MVTYEGCNSKKTDPKGARAGAAEVAVHGLSSWEARFQKTQASGLKNHLSQVLPLSYSLIAVAPRSQSGSQAQKVDRGAGEDLRN